MVFYNIENNISASVITISSDGIITGLTDKATGTDIITHDEDSGNISYFCSLDNKYFPKSLIYADGVMTVTMSDSNESKISFKVEIFDKYFTFEVMTQLPETYNLLTYANMKLNYKYDISDTFCAIGYAMNTFTHHVYFPSAESHEIKAECYREIGTLGSKIAVIAAPHNYHRDIIKMIASSVPAHTLPISSTGGAYALDYPANHGDYVIAGDSDPKYVNKWIKFYNEYSVDQVDFHQGVGTFRQGDFVFHKTGSAGGFKNRISKPFAKAGILTGLHSYSFYIDYNASEILSVKKWQNDLEILKEYTLSAPLSADGKSFDVKESTNDVSNYYGFMSHNTPFVLIDSEIIKFHLTSDGFVDCERGIAGTVASLHKHGAKVKHIGGFYGMIAPVPGSKLFYQIAKNTAEAYNAGGFRMIYLDALDGLTVHTNFNGTSQYTWYYWAEFVNELLKYTVNDPILEYSMIVPSIWNARGRAGAWDTPSRGYKTWNKLHIEDDKHLMERYYTTTLGWYNFFPQQGDYPGNFSVKYKFFDDVDQMGSLAIAYDCSIVYNGLTEQGIMSCPALRRNMKRYLTYNKLRKSHYFDDSVLEKIRNGKYEYQIQETKEKNYSFVEKSYSKGKINGEDYKITGCNPFKKQKPFIRIEALLSSDGSNPVTIMNFDENLPLNTQTLSSKFKEINIKDKLALKVHVYSPQKSSDALCIRLMGATESESGISDYLVKLDFEGWKDIILAEVDNGDFNDIPFNKPDNYYAFYRALVNYDRINSAEVFMSGACDGVKMGNIQAVTHVYNPITNPTLIVNGLYFKFDCVLNSTEYLEYIPDGGRIAVYDANGNQRIIRNTVGKLPFFSRGEYSATITGSSDLPLRATLTLGFTGNTIN